MEQSRPPEPAPAPDGLSITTIWRAAWRRRFLIIGVTLGLTALDLLAAMLLPPTYRAEVLLQVDRRASRAVDGNVAALEPELDGGALVGQAEIIRSPALALEVIAAQRLTEHPDFASLRADAEERPAGWLRMRMDEALEAVTAWLPPALVDRLLRRDQDDERLQEARRENALIRAFGKRLRVSYDLRGGSLRIAYVSGDPATAAAVANAVAAAYVDQQMRRKLDLLRSTSAWLDDRLEALRVKAVEAENRLAEFRHRHRLGTTLAPAFTQQQLGDLHAQLTEALGRQAQADARLRAAEEGAAGHRQQGVTEMVTSLTITRLREQEALLSRRIAELVSGGNLRTAQDVRAELGEIQKSLREERDRIIGALRSDAVAARNRRTSIEAAIEGMTAEAQERDRYSIEAAVLEREAAANRAVFDSAIRRTEEARLLDGLQRPDLGIVSAARMPGTPYFPNMTLIGLLGFVTSFAAGTGLGLLLEYRNQSIRSLSQGEAALGITGIGWLPTVRPRRRGMVHDVVVKTPGDAYSECVRSAAVSLRSLEPAARRVLLVTSTSPLEGKTSFALSYGRTLAAAHQACIVVDVDLRRPAVSERLRATSATGLSEFLLGQATLEQAIGTDESSGLAYLGAGQAAVDPLWALDSKGFDELLQELCRRYAVVILDAPPILPVSDGVLLARRADFVLLVITWGRTPLRLVQRTIARLRQAGAARLGFLLSHVDVAQLPRADGERAALAYYDRGGGKYSQKAPALRLVRTDRQ